MSSSSTRFFVMSFFNIYICNQAKKRLSKDGKQITLKKYLKFFIFLIVLLGINQVVFFFFEQPNLYEQLEINRSMPISQIKKYVKDLEIKIISMTHVPMNQRMKIIQRANNISQILSHPATRLTYDTFGLTDNQYAWAFKNQGFLLQMIVQSSVFYIIVIFMNMMNKSRDQMKQALKIEIMLIFLVFIWEIGVLLNTEQRFHEPTDWIDKIYSALPVFERRQLMKVLLFPITNICHFFLKFYLPNESQKKLVKVAKHPTLRNLTSKVRQHLSKIKSVEHIQDRVQVAISEIKNDQPLASQIYLLHRQVIRGIYLSQSQNILIDQQILKLLSYFHILNTTKKQNDKNQ